MESPLLSVAQYTVKHDGGRGAHREVVVVVDAADRLEHVVGTVEDLAREPPAGAEGHQLGRSVGAEAGAERVVPQANPPGTGGGRDDAGQGTGLALDVGDHAVEVVRQ